MANSFGPLKPVIAVIEAFTEFVRPKTLIALQNKTSVAVLVLLQSLLFGTGSKMLLDNIILSIMARDVEKETELLQPTVEDGPVVKTVSKSPPLADEDAPVAENKSKPTPQDVEDAPVVGRESKRLRKVPDLRRVFDIFLWVSKDIKLEVGFKVYQLQKKSKKKTEGWLKGLLSAKFYKPCKDHSGLKKNEGNMFCIDCNRCVCHNCLTCSSLHSGHKSFPIRRYVYHNVVRVPDILKHLDCSDVQAYKSNNSKVIFLKAREYSNTPKPDTGASCVVCNRVLTRPYRYCSITCKFPISACELMGESTTTLLETLDSSSDCEKENGIEDLKETLESRSSHVCEKQNLNERDEEESSVEMNKRKRRRKGVPHRAPFF
ncbi:hypothetical protein GIB67_005196 [Kingdonia uniflora]|uniref:B box-type domain-containing protein n=1 Tax=Kingdonia uniflora TaxID=39325 RepID=A0A7J7NNM7_9MAGN|nr:hypothetical protein GIB67_005196 [Kingdonia uniflora]